MILLDQIQCLLAKNNNRDPGWSRFLIFIIMAVIWIVGGLSKYKQSKVKESDFPEEEPDYDQIARALTHKKSTPSYPKRKLPEKKTPMITQKNSPLQMKHFKLDKLKTLEMTEPIPEKTKMQQAADAEPLIRLQNPTDLKAAVLYQEILGKPLSLRGYQPPN